MGCQVFVEKQEKINLRRNLGFAVFSGLFTGIVQQYLYAGGVGQTALFSRLLGDASTLSVAAKKSALDLTVHASLFQNPAAYFFTNLFTGLDPMAGIHKYCQRDEFLQATASTVAFWAPFQLMQFTVVPAHLRVGFGACISLCWQVVLSTLAYGTESKATGDPSPARLLISPA